MEEKYKITKVFYRDGFLIQDPRHKVLDRKLQVDSKSGGLIYHSFCKYRNVHPMNNVRIFEGEYDIPEFEVQLKSVYYLDDAGYSVNTGVMFAQVVDDAK